MFQTKDIDWLNGYKNKTLLYAVYKGQFSDLGHILTENERLAKYIPCKWKSKESRSDTFLFQLELFNLRGEHKRMRKLKNLFKARIR